MFYISQPSSSLKTSKIVCLEVFGLLIKVRVEANLVFIVISNPSESFSVEVMIDCCTFRKKRSTLFLFQGFLLYCCCLQRPAPPHPESASVLDLHRVDIALHQAVDPPSRRRNFTPFGIDFSFADERLRDATIRAVSEAARFKEIHIPHSAIYSYTKSIQSPWNSLTSTT